MALRSVLSRIYPQNTAVDTGDIKVDPNNPGAAQAAITRDQWNLFQTRYRPMENDVMATMFNPAYAQRLMDQAGTNAVNNVNAGYEITKRNFSRAGIKPTADQQKVLYRKLGLSRALADVTARNSTRDAVENADLEQAGQVLSIGRGISSSVSRDIGAAADMQSAREQAGRAAQTQYRQNQMSNLATGVGLAAAFLL